MLLFQQPSSSKGKGNIAPPSTQRGSHSPSLSFGPTFKGNDTIASKPISASVKKGKKTHGGGTSSISIDFDSDIKLTANLRAKKLDVELQELEIQKAKLALIAQREAADRETKKEEHQLRLIQLQLQLNRQQQQQHQPSFGANSHYQQQPVYAATNHSSQAGMQFGGLDITDGHGLGTQNFHNEPLDMTFNFTDLN